MDIIEIVFLEDGRLKVTTDAVSAPNHVSAEEFLKLVAQGLGGEVTAAPRKDAQARVHTHHGHTHCH